MMIDRVAEQDGRAIDFTLLGDPDAAVIDRYGLFNQADPPVMANAAGGRRC